MIGPERRNGAVHRSFRFMVSSAACSGVTVLSGGDQFPSGEMIGRPVYRVNSEQLTVPEVEHGELSAFHHTSDDGLVESSGETRHLETNIELVTPEPGHCCIRGRLSHDGASNRNCVIHCVLHGFEPDAG